MDPSQIFSGLMTPSFWVLVAIIGLLVSGLRWVIENTAKKIAYIFPDKYEAWWQWAWRECVLPAAPIIVGGLIGFFISAYPYPDPFGSTDAARTFLGLFAGLITNVAYPRIMYYVRNIMKTPGE
jgi:hypothetical protein